LPAYFRWFKYAFATSYLRRGPETVPTSPITTFDGRSL